MAPKGDEDTEWRILGRIASEMGASGFSYESSETVFDEINNLVTQYGGITYERLEEGGLQWPCLAADMADTGMLGSAANGSIGKMAAMILPEPPAHENKEYPLLLARGRILYDAGGDLEIEKNGRRNTIRRGRGCRAAPCRRPGHRRRGRRRCRRGMGQRPDACGGQAIQPVQGHGSHDPAIRNLGNRVGRLEGRRPDADGARSADGAGESRTGLRARPTASDMIESTYGRRRRP